VPVAVGLGFKAVDVEVAFEATSVAVDVGAALVELEPLLDPLASPSLTLLSLLSVWVLLLLWLWWP